MDDSYAHITGGTAIDRFSAAGRATFAQSGALALNEPVAAVEVAAEALSDGPAAVVGEAALVAPALDGAGAGDAAAGGHGEPRRPGGRDRR